MMNRDEIRAFIAIELPDGLKSSIREYETRLNAPAFRCAKWVAPASIHLTLKFLGQVNLKQVDEISRTTEMVVKHHRTFNLKTAGVGFFPDAARMRVFWLGLAGDIDKLQSLQRQLEDLMAGLGFTREGRPFAAHLTLARMREDCSIADRRSLADAVGKFAFAPCFSMDVISVSLIRSQLTHGGPVYTNLCRFSMQPPVG
jgi:2'-5' RNA ligase